MFSSLLRRDGGLVALAMAVTRVDDVLSASMSEKLGEFEWIWLTGEIPTI